MIALTKALIGKEVASTEAHIIVRWLGPTKRPSSWAKLAPLRMVMRWQRLRPRIPETQENEVYLPFMTRVK